MSREGADIGRRAEEAVADYLVAAGFVILARNARVGRLEVDIVARRAELVVVVEVRTRGPTALETALASVSPRKQARLRAATERLWNTRLKTLPGVERVRIDVAAVTFAGATTRVEYIEGALRA